MEKKVIDLEIIDELQDSGVDAIALVDSPAIEKNWMFFRKEQFVEPQSGESESDYMGRCVPTLIDEGKPQDQAVAICISTYQNMGKEQFAETCPPATQDIALNLANRQKSIDVAHYGPLNPNEPNEPYWAAKANMFNTTVEEAKTALCGNCAFFKTDQVTLDCIASGIGTEDGDPFDVIDAGQLGYCEAFDFKCAAARTCDAWVATSEEQFAKVSFDWDDTLSTARGKELLAKHKERGDQLYIITARTILGNDIIKYANEMRIPLSRVIATGSNKAKVEKIKSLGINKHIDNNATVITDLGNLGQKFEINTGGLAPYTQQTTKNKKDLVKKSIALASVNELNVGDEVSWKTADQNPRGRITEIVTGAKKVPGVDFEIKGTEEDPGYIIEIYEETEGGWKPSGRFVGRKADSILKNVMLSKVQLHIAELEAEEPGRYPDLSKVLEFAKTAGFAPSDFTENGMEFNSIPEGFDLELAKGYTVYKYSGSVGSDTRDFCRQMVGLDRFYTFEEIEAMGNQAVNPGFGLGGASTYSIWDWKGGPNCKHRWQKFYVTAEGTFQNKGPAPGKPGDKPEDMPNSGYAFSQTKMLFADESKHEIVGIAMVPDMEIPRKDKDGNIYFVKFSRDVIAKIAEKFMREQRLSATNIQHVDSDNAGSYVFESWITETETDKANSIYGLDAPIGSWVVKMRVTDETTWNKVKAGELKGLSIQGNFVSQEEFEAYMEDKKMYTDLVELIRTL